MSPWDFVRIRWPRGPRCPACGAPGSGNEVRGASGRWRCSGCGRRFSLTTGTRLERTHLSLESWAAAAAFVSRHRVWPGVVALRAAMGVSYQTAWRASKLLRPLHDAYAGGSEASSRMVRALLRRPPGP